MAEVAQAVSLFKAKQSEGGKRGGWPEPGSSQAGLGDARRSSWASDSITSWNFKSDVDADPSDEFGEATDKVVQDDGFHVQHLVITLGNFDFDCTAERRHKEETRQTPANQLVACIRKVSMRKSKSRTQEKLQDFILEWLQGPKKMQPPKRMDLDAFVDGRQEFWNSYRASTTKWHGLDGGVVQALGRSPKLPVGRGAQRVQAPMLYDSEQSLAFSRQTSRGSDTASAAPTKSLAFPQRSLDAAGQVAAVFFPSFEKAAWRQRIDKQPKDKLSDAAARFQKQCAAQRPVTAPAALETAVGHSQVLPRGTPPALSKFPPGFEERHLAAKVAGAKPRTRPNSAAELRVRGACEPCVERKAPKFPRLDRSCGHDVAATLDPQAKRCAREQRFAKPKLEKAELFLAAPMAHHIHPYTRDELVKKVKPVACEQAPLSLDSKPEIRRQALANALYFGGPHSEQCTLSRDKVGSRPGRQTGLFDSENTAKIVQTAVWRYFKECEVAKVMPKRPKFLVDAAADGEDVKTGLEAPYVVSVRDQALQDQDLMTLGQPLKLLETTCINLDLSHNAFSDAGVAKFLATVPQRDIRCIDLSHSGAAGESVRVILDRMDHQWTRLSCLQLGGHVLTDTLWGTLCAVLCDHGRIRRLDLVDMSLGKISQNCIKHVAELASVAHYLEHLDLSGNFFFHDGCEMLADSLKKTPSIRFLDLSHNAATQGVMPRRRRRYSSSEDSDHKPTLSKGSDGHMYEDLPNHHPAALLCESLSENTTLKELRLASSWLDFSVDCALLNALLRNKTLQTLDLSNNPHGEDGLRAILRLMMHPSQNLSFCEIGGFREGSLGPGVVQLDFGSPGGHFDLELAHPQHRAVVEWLFRVAQSSACRPPESAFQGLRWSGRSEPWFRHTEHGVDVAKHGMLSFDFHVPLPFEGEKSLPVAIRKWMFNRRVPVTLSRFVPLLAMIEGLESTEQQRTLIKERKKRRKMQRQRRRTCPGEEGATPIPTAQQHPQNSDAPAIRNLFANIVDADPLLLFSISQAHPNLGRSLRRDARGLFCFNTQSPTNRYVLDLSQLLDRHLAERLHVVNEYETALASRSERSDTSQHGNFEGARNIRWEDWNSQEKMEKVLPKSFIDFTIPKHGVLHLDYVSPPCCAPRRLAETMPDDLLDDLIKLCDLSECNVTDKVMALRNTMTSLVLNLEQITRMCEMFPNPGLAACPVVRTYRDLARERKKMMLPKASLGSAFQYHMQNSRIEVFVLLFNCCVDPPTLCTWQLQWNLKFFTMQCGKEIRHRLGTARTMDALYCCKTWGVPPENCRKTWDQRQIDHLATEAAKREQADGGLDALYTKSENELLELAKKEPGRRYVLDLSVHEDWAVARFLILLTKIEEGWTMAQCNWTGRGAATLQAGITFLVPPAWLDKTPQYGIFTCTYLTESPDRIRSEERRSLAERFLGWEPLRG